MHPMRDKYGNKEGVALVPSKIPSGFETQLYGMYQPPVVAKSDISIILTNILILSFRLC